MNRRESPVWCPGRRQEKRVGQTNSAAAPQHRPGSGSGSWSGSCGAESGPSQRRTARSVRHLEGVLKKYTNLLQGWQSRYFVLDPEINQLHYYRNEHNKSQRPPRGSLALLGAMVVSSDESPHMFTIYSTSGDSYKLRASNAEEQELWMTQLQLCSRRHSDSNAKAVGQAQEQQKNVVNSIETLSPRGGPLSALDEELLLLKATSSATLSCLGECLSLLQHNVIQALNQNQNHIPNASICNGPAGFNNTASTERSKPWFGRCGSGVTQVEPGGLRSSGQSPAHGVAESQSPKQSNLTGRERSDHNYVQMQNQACAPEGSPVGQSRSFDRQVKKDCSPQTPPASSNLDTQPEVIQVQQQTSNQESPDPSVETTDTEDNEEEDLGVLDDQRSIILHLLSQLKLGMDLTRVVLPTFILEKRSLLEMYANFMAHPDMFLSITSGCTPEERIVRFVEYYLTAFHEGRKGAVAKKPYNPILGETFHCSWHVPRDRVRSLRTTGCSGPNLVPAATSADSSSSQKGPDSCDGGISDSYQVRFVAEQVSHHPPVSGFYCECKEKKMCVNAHVWTKSKFMGMSVGVSMVGEGVLYLSEHDEEYVFTLPCAYARSILTVPWVELGGKVTISCAKSGYSATVTFHTKPFYGGKVHRVTAEVKHNHTGNIVCKAQGEWNGTLEFTYSNGENKTIDTSKLPVIKKKIQPLDKQGPYESRRLWQYVTASLKEGNMDAATEHKHRLEERQRIEGKQRAATKTPWKPKYFIKEGDGWVYCNPLWKVH